MLINQIKKGNINAKQLSQIMLGQMDLINIIAEDVAPPVAAPVALPAIPKELLD